MAILIPKKVKHRKSRKRAQKNPETRATELSFGSFGIKSMQAKRISSRQIEAARRGIIRYFKKGGRLWIRIFPDRPITKKGNEVPMGGGKGDVDHYVFAIRPGRIIFEIEGVSEDIARQALGKASDKLAVKTKFIKR